MKMTPETALAHEVQLWCGENGYIIIRQQSGVFYAPDGSRVKIGFPGLSDYLVIGENGSGEEVGNVEMGEDSEVEVMGDGWVCVFVRLKGKLYRLETVYIAFSNWVYFGHHGTLGSFST